MSQTAFATETDHGITLAAAATANSITLDPHREYTFFHLSVTAAGAANVTAIFLYFTSTAITADYTAGEEKLVLQGGKSQVVGPGIHEIWYIGTDVPVFSVNAGRQQLGGF